MENVKEVRKQGGEASEAAKQAKKRPLKKKIPSP
jgi:hypothetical protein